MHLRLQPAHLLAAAAVCAACLPAHAQSNVTVYGLVDAYFQYGKGDATLRSLESGGQSGSRLGFKGREDLGGGNAALFQLEMGIAADTGTLTQGGLGFGRQSLVGLAGRAGTLTAGRQYTPQFLGIDNFDPFATGAGSAQASGIISSISVRANNSVLYTSPDISGLVVSVLAAAGEKTTGNTFNVDAHYTAGPAELGVDYFQKKGFGTASAEARIAQVTGAYDFKTVRITGGAQSVKNATQAANAADDRSEFFGGAQVPLGAHRLTAGVGTTRTRDVGGSRATQLSLGYGYVLSKRTDLYVVGTRIDNGTLTAFTSDTATGSGPSVSAGHDVRALQFGIRHRF